MDGIQNFFQNLWGRIVRFFRNAKARNITIGVLVLLIASAILNVSEPHVSLASEPLLEEGPAWFTNSLFTTLIVDVVIIVMALIVRFNLEMIPSGFVNFVEFSIEGLLDLTESVAGRNARKFFPWVATIFIFVIVSNYVEVLPGVGSIGIIHEGGHVAQEAQTIFQKIDHQLASAQASFLVGTTAVETGVKGAAEAGAEFVPLFRPPSADLNMTLALAITTMVLVQFWGVQALGLGYFSKFFNLKGGKGFMGAIMFIVSILELISEFAKIISFSFRLFGNIFAGEVLLLVMAFLIAFLLPAPFFGLEVFVGFIQALVFMMLAVAFFSIAVTSHHDEH